MKPCHIPIEVLTYSDISGNIRPINFKVVPKEGPPRMLKIDKIIFEKKEKLAGNDMILFRCETSEGDVKRMAEIKYELDTCKWFIFRI